MPANPAHAFDLIVIGAGPAGLAAAHRSAQLGARTLLIDRAQAGGTSGNLGCIPKALLRYGAAMARCSGANPAADAWADTIARARGEVARQRDAHLAQLADAGVQWMRGMASLRGRGIVRVQTDTGKTTLRARQIVLAAGAHPMPLSAPGAELACTSDDVLGWDALPASLIVVGGTAIALELASTLAGFGVRVTLLARDARVLPEFDHALSDAAAHALAASGVELIAGADIARIERDAVNGDGVAVYVNPADNGISRVLRAQRVLGAVGRAPNTAGLGLEAAGVTLDARARIAVDRHFRTRARGVHAVGDICSGLPLQLAPVAAAQGRYVAERLFGKGVKLPDMSMVPTAVLCDPAIASVGLTEAEARARWPETDKRTPADRIDVVVRRFVPLEQRFAGTGRESLIKLVCNARSGRVLGAHIVDNAAPDIIQTLAVAVRMGVRLKHLRTTVGLHPSVAEALLAM
ncbi:Glutathione amide reductase [Ralstonia mannitolilytica]|uniref:dihydrolipoyl dehydrogenase family protein n=1 Tax=Ralstonia mannitolilytica TaxID=105219 RepID=UPI0007AFF5FC|nr:NAD(P)/FAD-dependent oxidoreductase [Ralstonia mannitolilytica]ANA33606.1 pyridine nucleotide-disulfide oxidoreductase [Ralstonia mannitolilytica]CAJ0693929.1 Glutathione amide reductase [Ralstonia mannitolilytica]CAJ0879891.1 Glutathione amide reductase [Ralstonia mannitolilytica]